MKYTIQEVMVGQIAVLFEDGSRAVVPVDATNTPTEIDHLVSYYDPDFMPKMAPLEVNQLISEGESRFSTRIVEESNLELPQLSPEEAAAVEFSEITVEDLMFALSVQARGDSSLMEIISERYQYSLGSGEMEQGIIDGYATRFRSINENYLTVARDHEAAKEGAEDIFNQALEELENVE